MSTFRSPLSRTSLCVAIATFTTLTTVTTPTFAQETNFDAIEITATPVAGSIVMLQGSGGNIAVLFGEEGVLMVDDQFLPLADKIKTAVRDLGGALPTYLLNTHHHGDHSGSNEAFADSSIIVAHDNVRVRMALPGSERVPEALPVITYGTNMNIHFNGEEIRLIHLPTGHTDGDTAVWFTNTNVIHMGDEFVVGGFPFVDLASGGNVAGLIANHAYILAQLPDDIRIIPGHGNLTTKAEFAAWAATVQTTAGLVTEQIAAGKSLEELIAAGLPEEYDSLGQGFISEEAWITAIYNSSTR